MVHESEGKMTDTKTGFDLLQLIADNTTDWRDSIWDKNAQGSERVLLMHSILNAREQMLKGRKLHRNAANAKLLFLEWAFAYDHLFMRGRELGLVPSDPKRKT